MPTILNPVAKISATTAVTLKASFPDLDIIGDGDCKIIMDVEDAAKELASTDYVVIEFVGIFIGSPKPKKRK